LHLLDYIGADYPPTVQDGKVIDEGEYREQQEFSAVLADLVKGLPANAEQAALEQGVQALRQAIDQRQEGTAVAKQARQLGARLAVAYEVSQAPVITPDPPVARRCMRKTARSATVTRGWRRPGWRGPGACPGQPARCGAPGPVEPVRPVQHPGPGHRRHRNAVLCRPAGRPPALGRGRLYRQLHRQAGSGKGDKTWNIADLARQTRPKSPPTKARRCVEAFRAQRAQPPQVKRGPAQLLEYTASTLDKSLAAYRAGDHDQAYDLSVAAYLEGFELVESSLDNIDTQARKDTEKS
jgi:high-affinity iron transporter